MYRDTLDPEHTVLRWRPDTESRVAVAPVVTYPEARRVRRVRSHHALLDAVEVKGCLVWCPVDAVLVESCLRVGGRRGGR